MSDGLGAYFHTCLALQFYLGIPHAFVFSVKMQEKSRLLLRIFSVVGKETFVVVAFSQIVIMLLNHFYPMPSILEYLVLMVALTVIVYLKNLINNICKTKIL